MYIEKIKQFLSAHKTTVALIGIILFLILAGVAIFNRFNDSKQAGSIEEVDLTFDPQGPYALIYPRRDGNAVILNLKRTASYDSISYELAYNSEGIDRGVVGTIDTKDHKGEYEQEILFGTCSKNVCKYDKDVENGTLTLHIRKGQSAFRMITQWHFQKPDIALGLLNSGDGHFNYKLDLKREELAIIGYSVINDLTGVPKLPDKKEVLGKVYSLTALIAKTLPAGDVTFEVANDLPQGAGFYRYDTSQNQWVNLNAQISGSKLSAQSETGGIFAVLIPTE
ncbi:hypothetical protein HY386_02580 [Candidatus Daviesbacteria bacterium]|nr:hypothetical protein [Candidatus Daviesbacteria bacterium]